MDALFRGIAIGFAIAAPVGPIGLLCISRTLVFGPWIGFASGLDAALADATYGALAAAGVSAFVLTARQLEVPLHVTGAIVLIALGLRTAFSRSVGTEEHTRYGLSTHAALLSTFALTAVNPATIISFAAIARKRLTPRVRHIITIGSGVVLAALGVVLSRVSAAR